MTIDAVTRNAARAVANVIRRALRQNDDTPHEERLSPRVLLAEALPLLEQMAQPEEVTE
jgi:uncharacterized protein (UPF0147 family)